MNPFEYDCAIVCNNVPNSAIKGLSLSHHEPVNVEKASKQHKEYLNALKKIGLEIIELEADENYPDCVFVEDIAIALNNRILITNPGALSRRGEINAIKHKLFEIKDKLKLDIVEVINKNESFIDGGDVCFTGREFIVGISSRTNEKGVEEIKNAFQGINVIKCHLKQGLHLKCFLTMIAKDTILIGVSECAKYLRQQIEHQSNHLNSYKFVEIEQDENGSANVLIANNRLFYNPTFKHLYEKLEEFQYYANLDQAHELENEELEKIDGSLTCRSILFKRGTQI